MQLVPSLLSHIHRDVVERWMDQKYAAIYVHCIILLNESQILLDVVSYVKQY